MNIINSMVQRLKAFMPKNQKYAYGVSYGRESI